MNVVTVVVVHFADSWSSQDSTNAPFAQDKRLSEIETGDTENRSR